MDLVEIFPEQDYAFTLRVKPVTPGVYFQESFGRSDALRERAYWLDHEPEKYARLLPEAVPLLEETIQQCLTWKCLSAEVETALLENAAPLKKCLFLGKALEPDLLLLTPAGEDFQLVGGVVCFPSSWRFEEKMGKPLSSIHEIVPGLNPALGEKIARFLRRLPPDEAWLRQNWGLTATPELNYHPDRKLALLKSPLRLPETWLRLERQALIKLPVSGGLLFAIRIEVHALLDVVSDSRVRSGLRRALETMSPELVRYKQLTPVLPELIALLTE